MLIVQPNFDLVVRSYVPPVLYRLLRVADVRQVGATSMLRMTQASLLCGLAAGERLEDLLAFLAEQSVYDLPQNVRYTLHDWAKHYHELTVADLVVFETTSAVAAATLDRVAAQLGVSVRLLAPGVWGVRRADLTDATLRALRKQVAQAGIVVR